MMVDFRLKGVFGMIVLAMINSCITPLDQEPADFEPNLVVQGFIDDDFGPHLIRITRVSRFASVREGGTSTIEPNAKVRIFDNEGNSTPLERLSVVVRQFSTDPCTVLFPVVDTDYQTPSTFKGEIGKSYTLEIITEEGSVYQSEPQEMLPTPPIDSLSFTFKVLPDLDKVAPTSGIEVAVSWQDPVENDNFYFWRINGIYKIYTPDKPNICCPRDPNDGGRDQCWIYERNIRTNELSFNDQLVNGEHVSLPVGFIEDDGIRFADRLFTPGDKQYYAEVEQYGMSREAFDFNQKIKILNDINGEIFDPPPVNVRGNIFNIEDEDERVIGFFGAFSVQKAGRFIDRSLFEFFQFNPEPCGDCRTRAGAQVEIPEPFK